MTSRVLTGDFWHGGPPGLLVGTILRPTHLSSQARAAYALAGAEYVEGIYVTPDKEFARAHAATWAERHGTAGDGSLYRVRPQGQLFDDPDYAGFDVSYVTSAAEIIAVDEERVRLTSKQANSRVLQFRRWPDGSPQYDETGMVAIPAGMSGPEAYALAQLQPWADLYSPVTQELLGDLVRKHQRRS